MNFIAKFFEQINGLNFVIKDKNNQNIEIYFFEGNEAALCIDKKNNKVLYKLNYNNLEVGLSNKEGLTLNIDGFILHLVIKESELENNLNPIVNKHVKNVNSTVNTSDTHTNNNETKKYYTNNNNNNYNNNNNNYNRNKLQNRNQRTTTNSNNNSFSNNVNNNNVNTNNTEKNVNTGQNVNSGQNDSNLNIENKEVINTQEVNNNTTNISQKKPSFLYNDPIMQSSVIECKYPYMTVCNSCKNKKCAQYDMLHKREDFNFGEGKISEDLYKQFDNYCKNKMEKFKCNAQ